MFTEVEMRVQHPRISPRFDFHSFEIGFVFASTWILGWRPPLAGLPTRKSNHIDRPHRIRYAAPMRVSKTSYLNPLMRWRWDANGLFGYSATKRGAAAAARAALGTR